MGTWVLVRIVSFRPSKATKGGTTSMCKLFVACGRLSRADALSLIAKAAQVFSRTQRDGFGFVAYGPGGAIAIGRYLQPANYPGFGSVLPGWVDVDRSESGRIPEIVTSLVCHGRTATSRVTLGNVHPFCAKDSILAHNGVLSWIGPGPAPKSSNGCDSEQFLNWYRSLKDPWGETAAHWSGYGVFGIMDPKRGRLTVAKCGSGRLSYAQSEGGTHYWSTEDSDVGSIVGDVEPIGRAFPMRSKTRCVFDVRARKVRLVEVKDWQGFGERERDADWFRSMGADKSPRRTRVEWKADRDSFPDWEPPVALSNGRVP
jgi:hypothetical protein